MKKAVIYSHTFYPNFGGLEKNTEVMAKALMESNYAVVVITKVALGNLPEKEDGYAVVRDISFKTLSQHVKSSNIVLINGGVSVPISIAAIINRKKLFFLHVMAGSLFHPVKNPMVFVNNIVRGMCSLFGLHVGVGKVCMQSKKIPSWIKQDVLYNPIHPDLIKTLDKTIIENRLPERIYDLLFIGRVIEGKGIFTLADALQLIDAKGISLHVCIAGNGAELEELKNRMSGYTSIRVTFLGFISGDEIAHTFLQSKVMVLPSNKHQEGNPLSISEAFLFGLPIIGSDQEAIMEIVGDAGLIFKKGDHKGLANCIEEILQDDKLELYKSKAAVRVSEFMYEDYKRKLIELIEKA